MALFLIPGRGNRTVLSLRLPLLFLLLLGVAGCKDEPPPPAPVRAIEWMRVEEPSAEQARMISGLLRAKESSDLNFDVSGLVASYSAELGDSVKKGQVLAQLDKEPFQLTVREAEADVARGKARLQDARAEYRRIRLLYEAENASKADLDGARANYEATNSQVKATESKLGIARRDLRKSTLRAPFDGTISERNLNVGERVIPLNVVYKLDGTGKGLQVQVGVPESLIPRVKQGQEVQVRFPANQKTTSAVVSEVGTRAGAGNAFPVKADLVEELPWARPGMTAEVTFTYALGSGKAAAPQPGGFMIPIDAVVPAGEKGHDTRDFYAFVFDQSTSTVRKTHIKARAIRNNRVDVVEGLKAGDVIATAGAEFLMDGQKVTLYEPKKY